MGEYCEKHSELTNKVGGAESKVAICTYVSIEEECPYKRAKKMSGLESESIIICTSKGIVEKSGLIDMAQDAAKSAPEIKTEEVTPASKSGRRPF